jgi:mono/diheme cytochrome c family protein
MTIPLPRPAIAAILLWTVSRNAMAQPVTFSEQIAPLLFEHCASCHRPEGSAPFSLLTYRDTRPRAKEIAAAVRGRRMPPWKPEPGYGDFAGERRLTGAQIALFERWLDQGSHEGDPASLPPQPIWKGQWRLGEPDLVVRMPAYRLRANGDDMYRNFVVAVPIETTRYIKAWEFLPGNPQVVHHATLQFDSTGRSQKLDSDDPQPGYEGLIAPSVRTPDGYFLDWGPGHAPYVAPDGMAWPLEKGTDLVMMLHLKPDGREETVEARLGLYFSELPPARIPTLVRMTRQSLDIAPGESHYLVTDSYVLDVNVDVYTIQPHAHYLAKEVRGFAVLPDGSRQWLIYIRDWDFNWQGVYRYTKPISLPAGTTLTMEIVYDNSATNRANPSRPPKRVTYGQRTSDEMAELWLQVLAADSTDRVKLARGIRAKILREEIVGHEKMLAADPGNAALHDDTALLYADAGNFERAAAHFAGSLSIIPSSPEAHYNMGTALLMQGKRADARQYLSKAIALKPDYGLALMQLAWLLSTSLDEQVRQPAEGLRLANDAVRLTQPPSARALDVLAAALAASGQYDRAATAAEAALARALEQRQVADPIRARLELYKQRRAYVE